MTPFSDPLLPGLIIAFNINDVLDLIGEAITEPGNHIDMVKGKIVDIRYERGKHCVLLYRIKYKDRSNHKSYQQLFSARVLRTDESAPMIQESHLAHYKVQPNIYINKPMIYIPKHRIVFYTFPFDPELPWIMDAINPSVMKQRLRSILVNLNISIRDVKIELLRYTPQMRASFLYGVVTDDRGISSSEVKWFIGKTHVHKGAGRRFSGSWGLWQAAQGCLSLAPPVGYINSPSITLEEKIVGQRLGDFVDSPLFVEMARSTARAIASFHRLSVPLTATRKLHEIKSLKRWSYVLDSIRPDLASRLKWLRDRLIVGLEIGTEVTGPVHGDFHINNILVDGTNIKIIDLDEVAYGDPFVDVGRFLASLRIPSLRTFGSLSGLAEAREAFLDEYLTMNPGNGNIQKARLFEAACLLTSAASPFRRQGAKWDNKVDLLLEEAERVFRMAEEGTTVVVPKVKDRRYEISFKDKMKWGIDCSYMKAILDLPIKERYGVELKVCSVLASSEIEIGGCIHYKLTGKSQTKEWGVEIKAIVLNNDRGYTIFKRLLSLSNVIGKDKNALLLPQPIAHLPHMSMILVESIMGTSFSSLIGNPAAVEVTTRFARALVTFHNMDAEKHKTRSLDDEFVGLRRKVALLKKHYPDVYPGAACLLTNIQEHALKIPLKISPILGTIDPNCIFLLEQRIAVDKVGWISFSHPYIDVGNFLANLELMGLKSDRINEAEAIADCFRASYTKEGGADLDGISVFEARALLSLACDELNHSQRNGIALKLLGCVEKLLSE